MIKSKIMSKNGERRSHVRVVARSPDRATLANHDSSSCEGGPVGRPAHNVRRETGPQRAEWKSHAEAQSSQRRNMSCITSAISAPLRELQDSHHHDSAPKSRPRRDANITTNIPTSINAAASQYGADN